MRALLTRTGRPFHDETGQMDAGKATWAAAVEETRDVGRSLANEHGGAWLGRKGRPGLVCEGDGGVSGSVS